MDHRASHRIGLEWNEDKNIMRNIFLTFGWYIIAKNWRQALMAVTREEIEQKMDELARKYVETHDNKIIEELYKLACELEKLEKGKN